MLRFWITAELYEMFRKRAEELEMSMSELLTAYVVSQTNHITLSPDDYERIAKEMRQKSS